MRVWAVSDLHGQLPQIPGCACSVARPIDSPSSLSQSPTPVQMDSSLRPPHPVRALRPRSPARGALSLIGNDGAARRVGELTIEFDK
jgi:hypothetical protein